MRNPNHQLRDVVNILSFQRDFHICVNVYRRVSNGIIWDIGIVNGYSYVDICVYIYIILGCKYIYIMYLFLVGKHVVLMGFEIFHWAMSPHTNGIFQISGQAHWIFQFQMLLY